MTILCLCMGLALSTHAAELNTQRLITDSSGRIVTVPGNIKRIACLYAFTGHAVTLLGRGDDIVAVARGLLRDSLLLEICPAIKKARVPKSQGGINIEELLKSKPDIVFLSGDVGHNPGETDKLNAFHLPYLVVDYDTMDGQKKAVTMIGDALGEEKRAKAYVDYFDQCIGKVQHTIRKLPENKRLRIYHSVNEANRTAIPNSISTQWLDALGVINVAAGNIGTLSGDKYRVGMEQIMVWNPDVIFTNEPSVQSMIRSDSRWAPLAAVRSNKVFLLPIAISRWGHPGSVETPLALLWAAGTLYPEQFKEVDIAGETRIFYQNFFDYRLSEKQVRMILEGRLKRKPKMKH